MGFQLPKKTIRFTFEGTDYDGAEVVLSRNIPVDRYLEAVVAKDAGDINAQVGYFAEALIEWNLEDDDGNPIPASLDGVRALTDLEFMLMLMRMWDQAVQEAVNTGPLSKRPSNNGAISASLTS